MRACSGESALAQIVGMPASTRFIAHSTDASTEDPMPTTAIWKLRALRLATACGWAASAWTMRVTLPRNDSASCGVALDGHDVVPEPLQLDRDRTAEPAEADDEHVVLVELLRHCGPPRHRGW